MKMCVMHAYVVCLFSAVMMADTLCRLTEQVSRKSIVVSAMEDKVSNCHYCQECTHTHNY